MLIISFQLWMNYLVSCEFCPEDDFLQGVLPIQKLQKYKSESKFPKMISKQIQKLLRYKRKYDQHMLQQLIQFLIQKLSYHNQQPNSLIYLGNNSGYFLNMILCSIDIFSSKKSLSSKTPITKEDFLSVIIPQSQYGAHSKPSDYQFKVTQSQLFNFDKREKESSLSIREKKLEEMLEEKKRNNSFKFKAQEVPQIVKQDGLYDKIINDNERCREEAKENSVKLTLKNEIKKLEISQYLHPKTIYIFSRTK